MEIDFEGTELTQPLAQALIQNHNTIFGEAASSIKKYQEKYKKAYDTKNKVKPVRLRKGSKVQYRIHKSKKAKSKAGTKWMPHRGYYTIKKIDRKKRQAILKNASGKSLKRSKPFSQLRKYRGK